ncbi:hypothetical protein QQG09_03680 [Melissococcus plutonius]|uniref:Uncharacterized protein n=2 Tax=Melissococcus plutonius TaxID=33970 RepID=F3YA21_MELPT|nr:hypothetical protein [Melissococcus plutonius]BAL62277.1 hypothetical protein MPD5_1052 [Melissococcus plutonius DAT561]AIM25691.1 hypothetical protein MEPL_c007880 [Melissococcus plutonius S1]KMT24991.1 hypothetical protein MEPL2_2c05350 [Melissococcus plutonius]KMT26627.1 hypothetical protein MEPL3_2c02980 [Melissococcus plutonius]KMT27877.1 hypothetical protein MEPL1_3c05280 [Melissococcus plutonius]
MKKEPQNLKAVPYQEILNIKNYSEQLQSWQEPLELLNNFFTFSDDTLNKKKVIQQYYACSHLFHSFYDEFNRLLPLETVSIDKLIQTEKVHTNSITKHN